MKDDSYLDRYDSLLPVGALISTIVSSEGVQLSAEEATVLDHITSRCSKLRRMRSHRIDGRLFVTIELDPSLDFDAVDLVPA